MSVLREVWTREVAGALEAHAVAVVQMAPGYWTFAPRACDLPVAARLVDDEWLIFDALLPADAARRFGHGWDALVANASLAGPLKLCARHRPGALQLRAEVVLEEEVPVGPRVQQVCASIAAAVGWLAAPETIPIPAAAALDEDAAADIDLAQLCSETQWPFTVRTPNMVMVTLDVPATFQQAVVELQPAQGVVAAVPVLPEVPVVPVCAAAAARCLLMATRALRLIRAAVRPPAPGACFEVVCARAPTVAQLAHAFAALSVAWRSAAREAEVLGRDADIAQLYLLESAKHHDAEGVCF